MSKLSLSQEYSKRKYVTLFSKLESEKFIIKSQSSHLFSISFISIQVSSKISLFAVSKGCSQISDFHLGAVHSIFHLIACLFITKKYGLLFFIIYIIHQKLSTIIYV